MLPDLQTDRYLVNHQSTNQHLTGLQQNILLLRYLVQIHGVQRRLISVDIFRIFEIIIFCFVVAICDLVHAVEDMYSLP